MSGSLMDLANFRNMAFSVPDLLQNWNFANTLIGTVIVAVVAGCAVLYYLYRNKRAVVKRAQSLLQPKPRFRKRDRVLFYGRKMLRKVRSISTPVTSSSLRGRSGRRRSSIAHKNNITDLAKKFLRFNREKEPVLEEKAVPDFILEADLSVTREKSEPIVPPEVLYMLRNIRVFGHFERPLFLELCKLMETRFVPAGGFLFKIGQPDDSIYVVQAGQLSVFKTDPNGTEWEMKVVGPGDSVHSLLSVLDVITGHTAPYKTVSARAVVDTTILRLPAEAFRTVFENYPESLVRVVQIIGVRLQRVTFMALHDYLGLSSELINPENQSNRRLSIHSFNRTSAKRPSLVTMTEQPAEKTEQQQPQHSSADELKESSDEALRQSRANSMPSGTAKKKILTKTMSLDKSDSKESQDFDVACIQARVHKFEDPIVSCSPTSPVHTYTARKMSAKKVSISMNPARESEGEDSDQAKPEESKLSFCLWEKSSPREDHILELATNDLATTLGLKDDTLLKGKAHLAHISAGRYLIKQGDQDCSMYFVVTGLLAMCQNQVDSSQESTLFLSHPGELVGTLGVLTGEPSFFSIKAKNDCRVLAISKTDTYRLIHANPYLVLQIAHSVVRRLSPFVRQIDFALDWVHIEAGRSVFRQGDDADCTYIVLNGRLRSVVTLKNGKKELAGEFGRGEIAGVVEVLTLTKRATTVHAIRDTELAKIPAGLLEVIKVTHPQVVTRLIHLMGKRILENVQGKKRDALSEYNTSGKPSVENLSTVAILPVSDAVPLSTMSLELQYALSAIGETLRLTSDLIKSKLGAAALDHINEFRLSNWLSQQEDIHRIVLYQSDFTMTAWTNRCIRQADCILIVGMADSDPKAIGEIEMQLEKIAARAQKEMILLHREVNGSYPPPRRTVEWLNARGWVTSHHHIRCPKRVFTRKTQSQVQDLYRKLFEKPPDRNSDFSRLARFLTGTSIGLVLGGGGAKGLSQVGIIKAMEEVNIPIDMVGGTSIGSFVGALYAEELSGDGVWRKAQPWCKVMSALWPKILDLTYPITAMFSGNGFNKSIMDVFKEKQIEDLWIPYFNVTTDISHSKMRVHTSGSLWRYVRSSMSLSGYLPPLCDPKDNALLLDGGYVNILPADVMKDFGVQTVIAVDVCSTDETELTNYGDSLSGWWLLFKRWCPWTSPIKVPDMNEVQGRLAFVSSVRLLEEVKQQCMYIRPPIDRYKTLDFHKCEELRDVGYHHGKVVFSSWQQGNILPELFREKDKDGGPISVRKSSQGFIPANATYTDLAEMVSRIKPPTAANSLGSQADFMDGYESDEEFEDEDEEEEDEDDDALKSSYPLTASEGDINERERSSQRGQWRLGSLSEGSIFESDSDKNDSEGVRQRRPNQDQ